MIKLFYYECRRTIGNKYFLALLLITSLYSYQLLTGTILLGTAYTAPFSAWSYGSYLSCMLPILLTALLFFLTLQYSRQARSFQVLADASPFPPSHYVLIRCLSVITAYLLLCICIFGISVYFYLRFFQFDGFTGYIIPMLLTLLPALLFVLGLGLMASRIHTSVLYALIPLVIILTQLELPLWADFSGISYFSQYPLTLPLDASGEPAFLVPLSLGAGKLAYSLIGIALLILSLPKRSR